MDNNVGDPGAAGGNAREQVNVPAILLMVVGGLTVAYGLYGAVQYLSGATAAQLDEALRNPQLPEWAKSLITAIAKLGIIGSLLHILLGGLTFFGGLKMKNLGSYGLAMAASIATLVPCCGSFFCLGIPIGIWSLVVLNKPEVKSSFVRT